MRRERIYWLCQGLSWSGHYLISVLFLRLGDSLSPKFAAAQALTDVTGILVTHLLRKWIHRHGWLNLSLRQTIWRVFAASVALGSAATAVSTLTSVFIFHFERDPHWKWPNIIIVLFSWSVLIFGWSVIYFGVHYFQGYRQGQMEQLRLAVAAKDSELRALLSQLNPHFIFNCLNSLRALIVEDPPRAQTMVDQLSSILRYSLKSGRVETVPLRDEIDAISAYLKLELIRFEDRLLVSMDIDPDSLPAEIPPMLLQTLVENGVKHGISRLAQGGEIRVVSRVEASGLRLQVINSGQLAPAGNTTQIGIDNARERLRILYGAAASLVLRNLDGQSVLAEVAMPFARGNL